MKLICWLEIIVEHLQLTDIIPTEKVKCLQKKNTLCFEDNLHFEWNMCNLEDTWNTNTACDLKWGQHQLCYKILSWVTRVTFSDKLHEGS